MPNRLQEAASLYLLQHAQNPVDWYPWGEEAFRRAKEENKPVLVSIGYAACHWCHVMAHENFEDEVTAAYMNKHFINIKVDREEHPDVDHLYMDALQAMTGNGGWPLNMFVTADKRPFYGGTYFPPKPLYGRSSWIQVLNAVVKAWKEKPYEIEAQAEQLLGHLQEASFSGTQQQSDGITGEKVKSITGALLQQADKEEGGFGAAPKFPATMAIRYLLEYFHFQKERENEEEPLAREALGQALLSLDKMIEGGIYDQVGGGFARYSTDREWLAPHFEKMLYDNALLIELLAVAYRITGKDSYKKVIEETIVFCKTDLCRGAERPEGFYCALDADSEGVEGKFYTWDHKQFLHALPDVHPAVSRYFGISEKGNWEGTNILHQAVPADELCMEYALTRSEWEYMLQEAREKLLLKRLERIPPATDDKILLSWNALMNGALTEAAIALGKDDYLADAEHHLNWLLSAFKNKDGSLNHVYKNGSSYIPGKLDDYAFLIKAILKFASASGKSGYVQEADTLLRYVQNNFESSENGFFHFSSRQQKDILVPKTELYDGATPSANAVMVEQIKILGNLTERKDWREQGNRMLHNMQSLVFGHPLSFSYWAILLQHEEEGTKQLIIAGNSAQALLKEWQQYFFPQVFVFLAGGAGSLAPSLESKSQSGEAALYLCEEFQCKMPVKSIMEIIGQIKKMP
jgi:uncharacterized protein YyaL (SSP411 family)